VTLSTTWWLSNPPPLVLAPPPARIPFAPNVLKVRREYPPLPPRWFSHRPPLHQGASRFTAFPFANIRGGDGLRLYLTGALSDGGSQDDAAGSLGGYRAATEAERVGTFLVAPIRGVQVVAASRANGADGNVGSLQSVTGGKLRYTAPGSTTSGPAVPILPGEIRLLPDGADPSKWIRVLRTTSDDLAGHGVVEFVDQLNNVFGLSNAANAESTGGGDRYRAVMLRNDDLLAIAGIKLYVPPLPYGSPATSSAAQLGGAGSGSITGAADAFLGWPKKGWARIETSGGSLREIVYYSSRTGTTLTVPSLGRGRLGTSAAAGASDDVLYPVPGIRIAHEAASPLRDGAVQTIADEETAPTGVTWSTARTAATGIAVGSLLTGEQVGIWIHRELPAGIDATAKAWTRIGLEYQSGGVTFTELLAGLYRIAVDARERYELHIGVDAPPDLADPPDETFTSLPYTTSTTFAAGTTLYLVLNSRTKFDMVSQYDVSTVITIDGSGDQVDDVPTAPQIESWEAAVGGTFRLQATYPHRQDTTPGDQWLIYVTYTGVDPVPGVDVPTVVDLVTNDVVAHLDWTSPTQANGTVGKVLVRVRRSSDTADSASSAVATATAATGGPSGDEVRGYYRKVAEAME
jgi:hypothetical protein